MLAIRLSSAARTDIAQLLRWSEAEFGVSARLRYEALIAAALRDLATDPRRIGSRERPELGKGLMSYHLLFSRKHVNIGVGIVRRPRHLVLYRLPDDSRLEVGRVLHDVMELAAHLPEAPASN